jgi:formate hydrogenlyase subunit 6/NADH:ubiquinone oxidoreductase subunit I
LAFEQVYRIVKPMIVALQHIFSTPVTIKYPYEKIVNTTGENYRYDPKAGVAYPGFKGRHVLYLDKCTGCSLCDIACQNIAEAIIMVYGFNITIQLSKEFVEAFRKGEESAGRVCREAYGQPVLLRSGS